MHFPDVLAKFFSGDGSFDDTVGTTGIHTDLADAANICLHAEVIPRLCHVMNIIL